MQYTCNGARRIPVQQGQAGTFYINLPSQSAPIGPTTGNLEEPFDLTSMTETVVSFPGGVNPVNEKYSLSQVSVQGPAGAGKLKVNYSALDSLNMQANPVPAQNQDLQVIVTTSGVLQIDTLTLPSPVNGTLYSMNINGQLFSYTATSTDTAFTIFTQLLNQMNTYAASLAAMLPVQAWNVSGLISSSGNSASLALTSTFAGLGFTDVVSGITKVLTQANAGSIAVFLFKFALNIEPQSYVIT